ncbi:hypothetical protein L1887_29360 [Cichorium endivia]|nr:hypothetical protein L1887_29360 [Cichorium endivia]
MLFKRRLRLHRFRLVDEILLLKRSGLQFLEVCFSNCAIYSIYILWQPNTPWNGITDSNSIGGGFGNEGMRGRGGAASNSDDSGY